jgi:hypothetical protein
MSFFRYGDYTFTNNPKSFTKNIEFIGDKLITESGRTIIQPTGYKENLSLTSIFYKPMHKLTEVDYIYPNAQCISPNVASTEQSFFVGMANGGIAEYNKNMILVDEGFPEPPLIESNVVGIAKILGFLIILCQGIDTHYLYIVNPSSPYEVYDYYTYDGVASGLVYMINYLSWFFCIFKQRKDGYIERISINTGEVEAAYDCLRDYATDNFSGACSYKGYYLTIHNNQTIYVVDLDLNKVVSRLLIGRSGDNEVYPGVSILDLSYPPGDSELNFFGAIDIGKEKMLRLELNTVDIDLYNLEKEIKKGEITLIDNHNVSYNVMVDDYNIVPLENYFNAYEVNLTATVVS